MGRTACAEPQCLYKGDLIRHFIFGGFVLFIEGRFVYKFYHSHIVASDVKGVGRVRELATFSKYSSRNTCFEDDSENAWG